MFNGVILINCPTKKRMIELHYHHFAATNKEINLFNNHYSLKTFRKKTGPYFLFPELYITYKVLLTAYFPPKLYLNLIKTLFSECIKNRENASQHYIDAIRNIKNIRNPIG